MKPRRRIRDIFRAKPEQLRPDPPKDGPLREFVYLDDVSVDSLVQSVRGGTLDQITEIHHDELQAELEGKVAATNLVTTGEVRSRLQSTMSDSSQALRRVGIQARFGELHRIVWPRRVLRPVDDEAIPEVTTLAQLLELAGGTEMASLWAVPASTLQRGKVIELDVELGSEPLFHMVEAMHQIVELWPEDPQVVGLESLPDLRQAQGIGQMISGLLGGLVPIRSRSLHFDAVTIDGEVWLVHPAILDRLPQSEVSDRRPLDVVGAAAQERFWKDRRRVVFAGARYRILARLVLDWLSESWVPVKMVETFKGMATGLAEGIDSATLLGKALLDGVDPTGGVLPMSGADAGQLVNRFTTEINSRFGTTGTIEELMGAGLHPPSAARIDSLAAAPSVLNPIAEYLLKDVSSPDRQAISDARHAAYQATVDATPSKNVDVDRDPLLLEVEFIAIYW